MTCMLTRRHACNSCLRPDRQSLSRTASLNRAIPLILAVALFMENMDSTILATALPAIAAAIGTDPIALKLALTSYFVALAIFIPISGWMAERFGAKQVFRAAILVFVTGSIACAASGSLAEFVGARFLQGMGGAMMTPVGRLVLVRSTPRSQLVTAMAWLTMPALFGPMIGPPVGGFITTFFSWHWIFLINVPVGLIGFLVAGRVLPAMPGGTPGSIDWIGFLLCAVAASGVVFGLSVVSMPALPPAIGASAVVIGIVAAIAYIRHARRAAAPILDLRLFDNPVPRIAILSGTMYRLAIGATPFLLPLMLQIGFGLSPLESGLITFASAIGAIMMKFAATPALRLAGFRSLLIFAAAIGSFLIAMHSLFTPATPYWIMIGTIMMSGFTRSMFFTANNALIFAEIEDRQTAQASAMTSVSQQISIALGVALAGTLLEAHHAVTGAETGLAAFSVAFLGVAAFGALSIIPMLRLSPDAGKNVSGHVRRQPPAPPSTD